MPRSLIVLTGICLSGAGAVFAEGDEPPRTYLFLYAESPSVALYSREHGSPYRHEPWMSDEKWESHYANVQANFPKLLDMVDGLRPDIFYLATNSNYQRFGMSKSDIPTLEQVAAQLAAQCDELAQYRERGAQDVGFYRCAVSIRGNPEQRHGIFALYDRWDEYAEIFHLGPKPPEDPIEWLQIRFDSGTPYVRAWDKPDAGGNIGYMCCPNNPYWRQLSVGIVRTAGEIGYSNLFVDNPSMFCKCKYCRVAFVEGLKARYSDEQWARLFPDIARGEADIEDPRLAVERDRFWQDSVGAHLAAMKSALQEANLDRPVFLAANGAQMTVGPWYTSRVNLEQFAAAGVNLGFKESPFEFSGVNLRPVGNGLLAVEPGEIYDSYRMVRGAGEDGYYGCPAQSYSNTSVHDNLYRLAMSEALAMDGCVLDGAHLAADLPSRPALYEYRRRNRELFAAGTSISRVAVIIGESEFHFEPDLRADASRDTYAIRNWLSDQQIPFDYLMDRAATPERLARYDVAIVPGYRSLDEGAVEALHTFAEAGGSLVLSGPVGMHYAAGPERPAPAFADLLGDIRPDGGLIHAPAGQGRVVACATRFADADLPEGFSTTDYKVSRPQTLGGKTRGPMLPVCVETNRELFLRALDLAAGRNLSAVTGTDASGLRVAGRYRTDTDRPWLALHIINERMSMHFTDTSHGFELAEDGAPVPHANVRVVVPLPEGFEAGRVRWAQVPQTDPQDLAFTQLAGGIECVVPEVEMYSVVLVDLQPGAGEGRTVADAAGAAQVAHVGQGLYIVADGEAPLQPAASAGEPLACPPVRLNFTHPVLVRAGTGDNVTLQIAAYGPAGKWARWWIADPQGELLDTGAVECGQTSEVSFTARQPGVHLVQAQADANDFSVASTTHALCLPATPDQRLNLTGQPPALYFRVPEGCAEVPLMLQTRDRDGVYEVADSQGRVVARRDGLGQATVMDPGGAMVWSDKSSGAAYQKVTVPVPEGEAGTVWSLRFTASKPDSIAPSNLYFGDGFPGLLSAAAEGV